MTPERWQEIRAAFDEARALDPAARIAFLERRCADDGALQAEVESLLAAESEAGAGGFLEAGLTPAPPEPRRLGAWELVRELGRGGMGTVWLARRVDDYRQAAAVKLLKRGLDTDEVLRRFRVERQILARLEHPGIARLLDGGSTPDGRPYLVMEHVEGLPIDEHCRARGLDLVHRLRLFLRVCAAVRYAHQRLVVHRDLKPSNVLVTETGVDARVGRPAAGRLLGQPKLLDFGIAKLLGSEEEDETAVATRVGRRPMTPEYASPEQLRGEPVTTTTDVYSLGVLLYELLTGVRPHALERGDDAAHLARALERSPQRPSSRVGAAAADRRERRRARALRGDLDTIALKALQADPRRRYASVEELAADLQRFLDGLPVQARPDTLAYRFGKFVGRHRLGVAAAAVAAGLAVGFVTTLVVERRATLRQQQRAEAVSRFLEDLFELPDPSRSRGESVTARQLLSRGAERIRSELGEQPEVQADLMATMGRSLSGLGLYAESRPLLEDALRAKRRLHGERHLEVAQALQRLADLDVFEGRYRQAAEESRQALGLREALAAGADERAESALREAEALALGGRPQEAAERFRAALEVARQGAPHERLAQVLDLYANLLADLGHDAEARPLFQEALALYRQAHGERHPDVALTLNDLALMERRHDADLAARLLKEAESLQRGLFHEPHPHLATTLNNLGLLWQEQGRWAEAEKAYGEALALARAVYQGDHPKLASTLVNLAGLRQAQGRYAEAEAGYREAAAMQERLLGPEHADTANTWNNLGETLSTLGRDDEAQLLFQRALEVLQARLGRRDRRVAAVLNNLGDVAQTHGDLAAAERRYVEALAILREALGPRHPDVGVAVHNLATLQEERGDVAAAEAGYREALAIGEPRLGPAHPRVALARLGLAGLLLRRGRVDEAEPLARAARDALAAALPASDPACQAAERVLARSRAGRGEAPRP